MRVRGRLRSEAVFMAVLGSLTVMLTPCARANMVTNGSFESNGGAGQLGYNTFATDWSTPASPGSYNFLFAPGTADTTGAVGSYGALALWGPGNGANNGLPASSPDGGYFLAADGDFETAPISQTISGLTVGDSYDVSFWWAASQQQGFYGPTTQQFQVSLGSDTQSTAAYNLSSQGFSGWQYQTFTYTASAPSEVLSFLASASPAVPPFLLLDGVSVQASAPEPSGAALGIGALLACYAVRKLRRAKA